MSELEEFLEEFIPRQEAADTALHNGDPEPRMELWSRRDPVTLLGAAGINVSGWEDVSETFSKIASQFSDCKSFRLEIIAAGVGSDVAYTAGFEYTKASIDGAARDYRLRVSHGYRREDGEWRIVHRHGDGLEGEAIAALAR